MARRVSLTRTEEEMARIPFIRNRTNIPRPVTRNPVTEAFLKSQGPESPGNVDASDKEKEDSSESPDGKKDGGK